MAAVIMEPVQNAAAASRPRRAMAARARDRDSYDVLLISDEVICSWGRLGEWFGAQRYGYQPDIITTAKGLTSAYAPMGAVIASDRVAEPFLEGTNSFIHGFTFAGHPISAAVAMANLDVFEQEGILENVRSNRDAFRECWIAARHPDRGRRARGRLFPRHRARQGPRHEEVVLVRRVRDVLRGFLSGELFRRGLICRADDRGDPRGPALAAVDRRAGRLRRDRVGPAPGPRGGHGPDGGLGGRPRPMLTVRELLRELDVRLLCGEAGLDAPVRRVHISELRDPARRGCRAASCC